MLLSTQPRLILWHEHVCADAALAEVSDEDQDQEGEKTQPVLSAASGSADKELTGNRYFYLSLLLVTECDVTSRLTNGLVQRASWMPS